MQQSYDELWRTVWGDMQRYGPVHRHTLENLVRTVTTLQVRTVLDVGCGSGENLAALAASGPYELTGTDISQEALRAAHQRVPSAQFRCLDAERETLSQRFDLVISVQVLEHLVDDLAALRNMAQMTQRYLFISTMQGRMRPSEAAIGHIRNYSPIELRRKLEAVGLEVVEISGWGFPFYSPLYRTVVEWLPGGPPSGSVGGLGQLGARFLYHLYRLNLARRGDVLSALAKQPQ